MIQSQVRTDSNSTFNSFIVNRCNLFIKSINVQSRKLLLVISLIIELTIEQTMQYTYYGHEKKAIIYISMLNQGFSSI